MNSAASAPRTGRRSRSLSRPSDLIDRILRGELHIDDVPARPDMVLIQDGVALKGLRKPRNATIDKLRASDRQVMLLRRLWKRELRAIEEGTADQAMARAARSGSDKRHRRWLIVLTHRVYSA